MLNRRVDLLVLEAAQAVTVPREFSDRDPLGIIDDGGVAVSDGRIVDVAATQYLERHYKSRRRVLASSQIILPGFIDPHTHLVFAGSREDEFEARVRGQDYLNRLGSGGGIIETVRKTRQATTEELYRLGAERVSIALSNGTTTLEIKTGYGLNAESELKLVKVINKLRQTHQANIVPTFLGAHAVSPDIPNAEDYTRYLIHSMLPLCKGVKFCDVFCENGAFNADQSQRILKAASKLGLESKIHADEFMNSGGAGVANRTGALSADHLVHSPMEELEKMKTTGVTPVLLPGSSQSLFMKQYAPARQMLDIGLPVALGTDFSPANWMLDQLTVAALASRELRMRPEEIIRGVTVNAARALGLDHDIGSISPRKQADLVLLNMPSHKWIGYAYNEGLVGKVLIRGRIVADRMRLEN